MLEDIWFGESWTSFQEILLRTSVLADVLTFPGDELETCTSLFISCWNWSGLKRRNQLGSAGKTPLELWLLAAHPLLDNLVLHSPGVVLLLLDLPPGSGDG